jgi:hypothetical protein
MRTPSWVASLSVNVQQFSSEESLPSDTDSISSASESLSSDYIMNDIEYIENDNPVSFICFMPYHTINITSLPVFRDTTTDIPSTRQ